MEQLALPFARPRGIRLRPRYSVRRDALVEDLGTSRHVYGLWSRLFGCWRVAVESGRSREIVPHQPILGGRGAATAARIEHPVFGPGALMDATSRRQASGAFAAYFAEVPSRLRVLVAPMGRYQWLGLDLAWQVEGFARFAEDEMHGRRGHYLYACLALAGAAGRPRHRRRALALAMMRRRRREVLGEIVGRPVSAAALRALARLPEGPCAAWVYEWLIALAADPVRLRVLAHLPEIAPVHLLVLGQLPDGAIDAKAVARLSRLAAAPAAVETVTRLLAELPKAARRQAVAGLGTRRGEGEDWLDRWLGRWQARLPFPAPPFATSARLRPLASATALRDEGRQMRNCLGDMLGEVLAGDIYFFHWDGREPATVMVERGPSGAWRAGAALGPGNAPLAPATRGAIAAEIHRRRAPPGTTIRGTRRA